MYYGLYTEDRGGVNMAIVAKDPYTGAIVKQWTGLWTAKDALWAIAKAWQRANPVPVVPTPTPGPIPPPIPSPIPGPGPSPWDDTGGGGGWTPIDGGGVQGPYSYVWGTGTVAADTWAPGTSAWDYPSMWYDRADTGGWNVTSAWSGFNSTGWYTGAGGWDAGGTWGASESGGGWFSRLGSWFSALFG